MSIPDPEWVLHMIKDKVVQATIFHYYGMQQDPWKIDPEEGFFLNFVQTIVNYLRPESDYVVKKSCKLYNCVCTLLSTSKSII